MKVIWFRSHNKFLSWYMCTFTLQCGWRADGVTSTSSVIIVIMTIWPFDNFMDSLRHHGHGYHNDAEQGNIDNLMNSLRHHGHVITMTMIRATLTSGGLSTTGVSSCSSPSCWSSIAHGESAGSEYSQLHRSPNTQQHVNMQKNMKSIKLGSRD